MNMSEIQDTIKTVNGMGGKETKTLFLKLEIKFLLASLPDY